MINQQVLGGSWHEVRGRLQEKWGKLTDDDLRAFNGNVEQLVGKIQRKTGETRAAIERVLDKIADDISHDAPQVVEAASRKVAGAAEQVTGAAREQLDNLRETAVEGYETLRDTARDSYDTIRESARDGYDAVRSSAQQGYAEAEQMVQERPGQSLAFAFGLGVLSGLAVAAMFGGRHSRG